MGVDGVHFADVGYAVVANAFIQEINAVLNTDIALVNIGAVAAADVESPAALRAHRRDPAECAGD